ncbi:HECT domain-containing protein [Plasmodiophora brassicae]
MPVAAPLLAVLVCLLVTSARSSDSATGCAEVTQWSFDEISVYLNALPDSDAQSCFEAALLSSIDAGRQDAVKFIISTYGIHMDRGIATRIAWYAYVLSCRDDTSNAARIMRNDLLPIVQATYQLSENEIVFRFAIRYDACPLPDMSRPADSLSQRPPHAPALDDDRQQVRTSVPRRSVTYRLEGRRWIRRPGSDSEEPSSTGNDIRPPGTEPADERHPLGLRTAGQSHAPICTDLPSPPLPPQLFPAGGIPQRRRRPRGDQDSSQLQDRNTRRRTQRPPLPPVGTINRNVERPPSTSTAPRPVLRRSNAALGVTATLREQERHLDGQAPSTAPIPDWKYRLRDGTQQEQAQMFLDRVSDLIDDGDERVRGRLFVMSESSHAIDEGGLSASLIQFASAEVVSRLSRAGQVLYSQFMDRAFIPWSPTMGTEDECRDLILLGALIGIIDNHRRLGPKRVMSLPIPLPAVAFRALLTDDALGLPTVTDDDAGETALAAVYRQYCGDRSPAQCKRDRQIDVDDMFPHVLGVDYNGTADGYIRGLVAVLLNSPAFYAMRYGYLATVRPPRRPPNSFEAMHMAVIGDTVVTMAKLGPKVKFLVDEDLCRRGVETAINNVRWVLAILSDVERADFVEAATGARCLPLTTDQHSMIQIVMHPYDHMTFHTCFRTVDVPFALAKNKDDLLVHLRDAVNEFVGQGITSTSHNAI